MQIDHLPAAPGVYRITCQHCERDYVGRYQPKPGQAWHGNEHIDACSLAGHSHTIDVLELCPEEATPVREGYWMDTLCSYTWNGGYNIAEHDANGLVRASEQTKRKLSRSLKANPKVVKRSQALGHDQGKKNKESGHIETLPHHYGRPNRFNGNPEKFDIKPSPAHTAVKWGFSSLAAYRAAVSAKLRLARAKRLGETEDVLVPLRMAARAANANRPPKHLRPKCVEDLLDYNSSK